MVAGGGIANDGEVVDLEVTDRACLYVAGDAGGGGLDAKRGGFCGWVFFRVWR